jgi:drug/metabolite transporter (DMT)-like permease
MREGFNIAGMLFAILGAACYAIYIFLANNPAMRNMDSAWLTFLLSIGCAALFLVYSLLTHSFIIPTTLQTWFYCLLLSVLATALPIQLMLKGLQRISSMRAAMISVLEPLMTVFIGILLLSEMLSGLQFLGCGLLLMSALLVQFTKEL